MSSEEKPEEKKAPTRAFLVVNGLHVITIEKQSTSIGRKDDNDVVINSPHVSRYHAQIRHANGHFFIIDLDTTVGTSINGKIIQKALLKPGDVISLGGVPVIFGQGTPKSSLRKAGKTAPFTTGTAPTDATDLNVADRYLDLFSYPEEE